LDAEDSGDDLIAFEQRHSVEISGPLPAPQALADYERLLPGTAQVIIEMAQRQQEHRFHLERDAQAADIEHRTAALRLQGETSRGVFRSDLLGQALSFVVAGACVAGAVYCAVYDRGALAIAAFLSLPVGAIIKAIKDQPPKK